MATAVAITKYPFDPTGRLASNLVSGEQHALTGVTGHSFYFFIPQYAPFFEEGLIVTYKTLNGETRTLVKGVDYYPTHYFLGASRSCNKPIYSSISILNRALVGTVTLRYQTLGGEWIKDANVISEVLADRIHNPRITTWEQVVDMPALFPVVDHAWNLVDMVGMSKVVEAINLMSDKILQAGSSLSSQHINDRGNPHGLTAGDIGAVTVSQLTARVNEAVRNAGAANTDTLVEGAKNLFITDSRVRAVTLGTIPSAQNVSIAATDKFIDALAKLQVQTTELVKKVDAKANSTNPSFQGVVLESLGTVNATTATTSLKIRDASSWRVNIQATTAIQFDTTGIGDATGKMVEFDLVTVNDATANRALSWPSNIRWVDGVTPPRTLAARGRDEYYFSSDDNMVTWTGSLANLNIK
jgi:hypothetical protein